MTLSPFYFGFSIRSRITLSAWSLTSDILRWFPKNNSVFNDVRIELYHQRVEPSSSDMFFIEMSTDALNLFNERDWSWECPLTLLLRYKPVSGTNLLTYFPQTSIPRDLFVTKGEIPFSYVRKTNVSQPSVRNRSFRPCLLWESESTLV